jgi:hypothetical protein
MKIPFSVFSFSKKVVARTFYLGPLLSDFHVSLCPTGHDGLYDKKVRGYEKRKRNALASNPPPSF